ncbi:hypothetical protein [Jiella mangrovi]|uniref:YcxB family protein n=1 Tax=Jiella mangrovi TaxID=2821407 RepID=A0ABS4BG55_9HYPH|nr:hypothetical protein [Jiella mangrovi]MBP0615517.1 hypothetical protein [Jiella mangrovi]
MSATDDPLLRTGSLGTQQTSEPPGKMPWQRAARQEPSFRRQTMLTLDDFLVGNDIRWIGDRTSFVAVVMLCGAGAGLFLGYDDYRAHEVAGMLATIVLAIAASALLALPLHWLCARLVRWFLERSLRKRGAIGILFDMEVSRGGIELTAPWDEQTTNVTSMQFPWPSILALEADETRYLFWFASRDALAFHRELLSTDGEKSEEAEFRDCIERWSGRRIVTPPVFARNRRAREQKWDSPPAKSPDRQSEG